MSKSMVGIAGGGGSNQSVVFKLEELRKDILTIINNNSINTFLLDISDSTNQINEDLNIQLENVNNIDSSFQIIYSETNNIYDILDKISIIDFSNIDLDSLETSLNTYGASFNISQIDSSLQQIENAIGFSLVYQDLNDISNTLNTTKPIIDNYTTLIASNVQNIETENEKVFPYDGVYQDLNDISDALNVTQQTINAYGISIHSNLDNLEDISKSLNETTSLVLDYSFDISNTFVIDYPSDISGHIYNLDFSLNIIKQIIVDISDNIISDPQIDSSLSTIYTMLDNILFSNIYNQLTLIDNNHTTIKDKIQHIDSCMNIMSQTINPKIIQLEDISNDIDFIDACFNIMRQAIHDELISASGSLERIDNSMSIVRVTISGELWSISENIEFIDTSLNIMEQTINEELDSIRGTLENINTFVVDEVGFVKQDVSTIGSDFNAISYNEVFQSINDFVQHTDNSLNILVDDISGYVVNINNNVTYNLVALNNVGNNLEVNDATSIFEDLESISLRESRLINFISIIDMNSR